MARYGIGRECPTICLSRYSCIITFFSSELCVEILKSAFQRQRFINVIVIGLSQLQSNLGLREF